MADNIQLILATATTGPTIKTDDDGTAHWPYSKLAFGPDNTQTIVGAGNPLPIEISDGTDTVGVSTTNNLNVAVATSLPAGTNAIGKLAANSGVDIGDVDVLSVPTPLNVTGGGTEAAVLRVTLANNSTGLISVDDNGGSLTVDNGGTFAVQVDASLPTGDNNIGNVDIVTVPAPLNVVGGGVEATALRVTLANNSTGLLSVDDNGGSLTVDNAGLTELAAAINASSQMDVNIAAQAAAVTVDGSGVTQPVSGTVTASQATASNLNVQAVGNVAHSATDTGNPVKIGGVGRTTNPTAVTDGDRADLYTDDLGRAVVLPQAPRDLVKSNRSTHTTTATGTVMAAGGAGVFRDLTLLTLSNESGTEVRADIRSATGGGVRLSMDLAANGGGAVIPFSPPLTATAANANWNVTLSAAVSTVYITAVAVENN